MKAAFLSIFIILGYFITTIGGLIFIVVSFLKGIGMINLEWYSIFDIPLFILGYWLVPFAIALILALIVDVVNKLKSFKEH